MLIDWFTVVAQVINFLILVWLLKRFLYRPILDAIDAREQRIAQSITDAEAKQIAAQTQRDLYQQKNTQFDEQRDVHMREMQQAADTQRAQLLDAARKEAEELRARLQQALTNEQRSLKQEISQRAGDEVFAIARKALTDLAASSLEQRMTDVLLERLRGLNDTQMAELKAAFSTSSDALLIRSAFKLPEPQCAAIATLVGELFGAHKPIQYAIEPQLVSGIELSCNGHKVAWSIAEYLAALSHSVDHLLKANTEADSSEEVDRAAHSTQQVATSDA